MSLFDQVLQRYLRDDVDVQSCPRATQDLELNLQNRQDAIDTKMYGPANPQLDESGRNQQFWQ